MAGHGGYKHRKIDNLQRRTQRRVKARACIARVRKQFEDKGQTWDPKNNQAQMAALNHEARRVLAESEYARH